MFTLKRKFLLQKSPDEKRYTDSARFQNKTKKPGIGLAFKNYVNKLKRLSPEFLFWVGP